MSQVAIVSMNLGLRIVLLDDDRLVPIETLYDNAGEETDDPNEAVVVIAGDDEIGYFHFPVSAFDGAAVIQ